MDSLRLAAENPTTYVALLIVGALTFVVALAYNELIQSYFKKHFMVEGDEVKANFWYAIIVTIILICLAFILPKMARRY